MEVSERFVFALTEVHKSVTHRLIRGSIRVRLARYESDPQCKTIVYAFRVFRSAVWIRPMALHRSQHGKLPEILECVIQTIVDEKKFYERKAVRFPRYLVEFVWLNCIVYFWNLKWDRYVFNIWRKAKAGKNSNAV